MTIAKGDIAELMARKTGLTKKAATEALEAALTSITDKVADGEKVMLHGFGVFQVREKDARTGRNPRTGETVEIAATRVPVFKPSSLFKDVCLFNDVCKS